jgi:cytochrome c peroxidase
MGVYKDYFADRAGGLNGLKQMSLAKEDLGRFNVTRAEADRYVFKVPTLRNIKKTFPYLHDGTIRSLSRTVEIMGEYQVGKIIPKEDVTKIVLFLKTL